MAKTPSKTKKTSAKAEKPQESAALPATTNDPWKGKAVTKADGIFHRLFDRFEPENVVARAKAKAEVRIIKAQSEAEAALVSAQGKLALRSLEERAAARIVTSDLRQQENIEAVMKEAYAALPPPDEGISDEPVSEDFIHRLFEDCKNIGDAEMQSLWGRILAGEIVRPGSFHPKTLGIVKDLQKDDANLFTKLLGFGISGEDGIRPIVFDEIDSIYRDKQINFRTLSHMEYLGLLQYSASSYGINHMPRKFIVNYFQEELLITLPENVLFHTGRVLLSRAGIELAKLANPVPVQGFVQYAMAKWAKNGVVVTPV
jgi:hypothetical protein